jgi:hypothetical protein
MSILAVRGPSEPLAQMGPSEWIDDEIERQLEDHQDSQNTTDTLARSDFDELVIRFRRRGGHQRDALRGEIIRQVERAKQPANQLHWTLYLLLSERRPGRLDDCVDILAAIDSTIFVDMLLSFLRRWIANDCPASDDDILYVVIRGIGRQVPKCEINLMSALTTLEPISDLVAREAIVEAYGDIATPDAIDRLKHIAESDNDPWIQSIAREEIEDCEAMANLK